MKQGDTLTYRRARSISLVGLGIQASLAVALGLYAQYSGGDHTATTAAIAVGLGVIVWAALALLFDQHRRERIEALEAETLAAAESAAASAFAGTGEELLVAARRLALIQRWVLPIVSLVFGGLMLGLGIVRLQGARALFSPDDFVEPPLPGWGVGVGLAAAFGGFVFARFASGMAKQKSWTAVRAGAAQAVLASIIGVAMAVALFVLLAGGPDWPVRILQVGLPLAMILLGAEVFLNFVLDLYRPRKAGEATRPSFDSRVLGFAAAPDKIAQSVGEALNYQFGVDVTSTWFYQLLSRSIMMLVVLAAVVAWAMTTLVVIQPHQRGMVLTFGEISRPLASFGEVGERDVGPGLHVKWPWPISVIEVPKYTLETAARDEQVSTATGVQTINLAANPPDRDETGPILWGTQHTTVEVYNIVQPEAGHNELDAEGTTADLSLVALEVPVHYIIEDVELYDQIAAPGQRRQLLTSIGRTVVTRYVSAITVDEVIATDRTELADRLRGEIERAYGRLNDGRGAGVQLLFVGVSGAHPPRDVAPNFERVVQARQNRESKIEAAEQDKTRVLTSVAGRVDLAERIVGVLDRIEAMRRAGAAPSAVEALETEAQLMLATAGGEAGRLIQEASAMRWTRHMDARAALELHRGQSMAHAAAPGLYRAGLYFDALKAAMRPARVYILQEGIPRDVVIELQDQRQGRDVFDADAGAPQ